MVSLTTDQGTEIALGELPAFDLKHIFHGPLLEVEHDGASSEGSEAAYATAVATSHMFPFTLVVVGMLHILHKLVEEACLCGGGSWTC